MRSFILYGTSGCHLCEQAEALLAPLLSRRGWDLREVDISDSDELLERYGVRIPVLLRVADGGELGWPFAQAEAEAFVDR